MLSLYLAILSFSFKDSSSFKNTSSIIVTIEFTSILVCSIITPGSVIFKEANLVTLTSSSPVSFTTNNKNLSNKLTKGVKIITLLMLNIV